MYVYFGLYLGDLKLRTSIKVCAIFSMWSAWMEVTGTKHKRKKRIFRLVSLEFLLLLQDFFPSIVMFHQWYHCHVTWYWTIIIKRSIINIEMQSLDRRLWLELVDLIRRWACVLLIISRCLRAMMTLIRRTTNIRRSIARLYANLFSSSLCTMKMC